MLEYLNFVVIYCFCQFLEDLLHFDTFQMLQNNSSAAVKMDDFDSDGDMEVSQWRLDWSPLANLPPIDEETEDTLIQLQMLNPPAETIENLIENMQHEHEQTSVDQPIIAPNPTQNNTIEPDTMPSPTPTVQVDQDATILPEFDRNFINMSTDDMQHFIDGQQNKNTMKKTAREIAQVMRFLKLKNEHRELHQIPGEELDPLLASFLLTVRKKDGNEFEPSSLRSIVSSIDRKLKKDTNMDIL